jgi:hypothetical protein
MNSEKFHKAFPFADELGTGLSRFNFSGKQHLWPWSVVGGTRGKDAA